MPQTTSRGKTVYSVDMMFAYINLFKPKPTTLAVESLELDMDTKGWGSGDARYSVNDVLREPNAYPDEIKRVRDADLSYPIIVSKAGVIWDGVHRVVKARMEKRSHIRAYEFDDRTMSMFVIDRKGAYDKPLHEIIELFHRRMCDQKRTRARSRSRSRSRK
jgi:hypothetical protein